MITKKDMGKKSDGDIIETVGLVKAYSVKPKKAGGSYIEGELELKGTVSFKIWDGSATYDDFVNFDYTNTVCNIKGKVNEYSGNKSIIVTGAKALDGYQQEDFFEERYNKEAYWDNFVALLEKKLSPEAYNIFCKVMEKIEDRFKLEFAAKSWHDAVKSGLLAHSFKVTHIMSRALAHYPELVAHCSQDILILGSALHDIGKVYEYASGSISPLGHIVSHHTFGVELLFGIKEFIISLKGEEFYYRLLAVVEQHHGEFEESPRTIEAYTIFCIDQLEFRLQSITEAISRGMSDTILVDKFKLC